MCKKTDFDCPPAVFFVEEKIMEHKDSFAGYHPAVCLLYFLQTIIFSMLFTHPVCLAVSLLSSFSYSAVLGGKKTLKRGLALILPAAVLTAVINPVFSHQGVTVLAYLPGGNPLTLEAILYGAAAAMMLASAVCWFSCVGKVMTTDKIVFLFGRIIPSLSLLLSMTLRFVPRFTSQLRQVSAAQRGVGADISRGGVISKIKNGIHILSVTVTWALESSVVTADSMKARGYGLEKRTAFSVFRFEKRDRAALIFLAAAGLYIIAGAIFGGLKFQYYPSLKADWSVYSFTLFAAYLALCLTPLYLHAKEAVKWKRLLRKNC